MSDVITGILTGAARSAEAVEELALQTVAGGPWL